MSIPSGLSLQGLGLGLVLPLSHVVQLGVEHVIVTVDSPVFVFMTGHDNDKIVTQAGIRGPSEDPLACEYQQRDSSQF